MHFQHFISISLSTLTLSHLNIYEDIDIPVILGRPFMLTTSCIVDMGKRKMELGFEDQKIDFDLFVEDKPAPGHNVWL